MKQQKLLFVYNANSDLFSTVTDFAHKIISPTTYQCNLCALTYGNFSIKQDWKTFLEKLPFKAHFKHKDEFDKEHPIAAQFPAVFMMKDNQVNEIINRNELEACKTLEQLKELLTHRIHHVSV